MDMLSYCDSAYWDRVTFDWYIVRHRHGAIQSQTQKESYSKEEESTPSCISWAWWVPAPGKLISQAQEASYSKKEEDGWGTLPGLSGIWALWLSVPRGPHWSSQWSHCTSNHHGTYRKVSSMGQQQFLGHKAERIRCTGDIHCACHSCMGYQWRLKRRYHLSRRYNGSMIELAYDSDQDAVHGVPSAQMWRDETDYHLNIPRYESRWQATESSQYPTFEGLGTQTFPLEISQAAVVQYPPYQGQGTQHDVIGEDRFYKHSESWGNQRHPWNNDDPLMMMKQYWPDSCLAVAQHMRNDDQDFCTLSVSQSRLDSRTHSQEGCGSHGDEWANDMKVREQHFSESHELRFESLD